MCCNCCCLGMKENMRRGVTRGQTQLDTATDEEWQRELIKNADGLENLIVALRGAGVPPDWKFFSDFRVTNVRLLWQDTGLLSQATFTGTSVGADARTRWQNLLRSVRERPSRARRDATPNHSATNPLSSAGVMLATNPLSGAGVTLLDESIPSSA